MTIQKIYNSLRIVVRGIIIMSTRRDVQLVLLGIILTGLAQFIIDTIKADWRLPVIWIAILTAIYVLVFTIVILFIRYILTDIHKIEIKDKAEEEKETKGKEMTVLLLY